MRPRGLRFGPDGDLYIAEAAKGGSVSTAGLCPQVSFAPGPYTGGMTADIVKVNSQANVSVVAKVFAHVSVPQDFLGPLRTHPKAVIPIAESDPFCSEAQFRLWRCPLASTRRLPGREPAASSSANADGN